MRALSKALHTLGACGLIGGLACYLALLAFAPSEPAAYADLRAAIRTITAYVIVPSLAVTLITGVLSMVVQPAFFDRGWALVKAVTGIALFEGTLVVVAGRAERAADLSRRIADGEAAALDAALANEWAALGFILALSIANVALGVWRPRLWPRPKPD